MFLLIKKRLRIDAQHKQFDIIINILISGIMITNALRFITGFQISNNKKFYNAINCTGYIHCNMKQTHVNIFYTYTMLWIRKKNCR